MTQRRSRGRERFITVPAGPGAFRRGRAGLRLTAVLLAAVLLLSGLSGCRGAGKGEIFRTDISGEVKNLDPQFATTADARMIIYNIYEGLVVQDDTGAIQPGTAQSYEVSGDGLTYTFSLRRELFWSDGKTPLTAKDFVFAFQRLFSPQAPSPYATDFMLIENSREILSGNLPVDRMGVAAPDDHTLQFTLEHESAFFPELLASSAAMPCNEAFFNEAKGRYGLERKFILSNGPFSLTGWDNTKLIQLRANEHYLSELPAVAGGVNLYIGRTGHVSQFENGKADLVVLPYDELADAVSHGAVLRPYDKTVWCLVFNLKQELWSDPLIRQGMAGAVSRDLIQTDLGDNFTSTEVFIPPAIQLMEYSYRSLAGEDSPLSFDPEISRRLFDLGLEQNGLDSLPATTLIVPDTDDHFWNMSLVQQSWQKYLSAYVNLEPATPRQIEDAFRQGEYQVMLAPFSPTSPRLDSLLGAFSSDSYQNYCGYYNPRYDAALTDASDESTVALAARKYWQAEAILLSDAVVVPVYYETTYYAMGKTVQHIQISPFAGKIYFKYAVK